MELTTNNLDKLAPALVALQAELTPVDKSADNPFFKSSYAPLPEVMKALQPLLSKNKLAISQFVTNLDGQSAMATMLIHESGQVLTVPPQPLLLTKQDPQSQGSAITYARRYGVMAVLGLVADEDDDGNRASHTASPAQSYNNNYNQAAPRVNTSTNPPSDAQVRLIRELASQQGLEPAEIEAKLKVITTSALASATISKLKGE